MVSLHLEMGMTVDGLPEYLKAHGKSGWIKGLSDARPFGDSVPSIADYHVDVFQYRVKDVFYWYYLKTYYPDLVAPIPEMTPIAKRDQLIAEAKRRFE